MYTNESSNQVFPFLQKSMPALIYTFDILHKRNDWKHDFFQNKSYGRISEPHLN